MKRTKGRMAFESICVNNRLWVFRVSGRIALSFSAAFMMSCCFFVPRRNVAVLPTYCTAEKKNIKQNTQTHTHSLIPTEYIRLFRTLNRRTWWNSAQMPKSVRNMIFLFFDFKWEISTNKIQNVPIECECNMSRYCAMWNLCTATFTNTYFRA